MTQVGQGQEGVVERKEEGRGESQGTQILKAMRKSDKLSSFLKSSQGYKCSSSVPACWAEHKDANDFLKKEKEKEGNTMVEFFNSMNVLTNQLCNLKQVV